MRQKYLVGYAHRHGFGTAEVPGPPQITGLADAKALAQMIEQNTDAQQVVVLNIQPLPIVPNG